MLFCTNMDIMLTGFGPMFTEVAHLLAMLLCVLISMKSLSMQRLPAPQYP